MSAPRAVKGHDIELKALIQYALTHWKVGVSLAGALVFMGLIFQVLLTPFELKTQIVINDAQTSQLQAFSSNFFGVKKQTPSRKNQSGSARAVEFLQRPESYEQFARSLILKDNSNALEASSEPHAAALQAKFGNDWNSNPDKIKEIAQVTRSMVSLSAGSPTDLLIAVSSRNRNLTYVLSVEFSSFALEALKQLERKEIEQVRSALEKQRDHFRDQFMKLNRELITFQTRPDHVLSLASGDNISNYLSDLMIRKNEVELKVNENLRTIEFLGGKKAAILAANRNLGQRSHIQQLSEATNLLRKQAAAIQDSINKFTRATSGSAEVIRIAEELKKTSDRELKNFQESTDLLSKLGMIETAIDSKFEIIRTPFLEEVRKTASIWTAIALALFLSQVLFAGFVLWSWMQVAQKLVPTSSFGAKTGSSENVISLVRSPTQEL